MAYLRVRKFYPQIASDNHDPISGGNNLNARIETPPVLNLGNNRDMVPPLAQLRSDLMDIVRRVDKRSEYHVNSVLDAEPEVALVFFRNGREVKGRVGEVDSFPGG